MMMMNSTVGELGPQVRTTSGLFTDNLFRIPVYQRPYDWEQKQCRDFYTDVLSLPKHRTRYMGTVMLYADPTNQEYRSNGGKRLLCNDVVDGQQRLTTIVIIMKVISEHLCNEAIADNIVKQYCRITLLGNQTPELILKPNDDNEKYFERVLFEGNNISSDDHQIESHSRLYKAKQYFTREVLDKREEMEPLEFEDWLIALYFTIADRLLFICYRVNDEVEVAEIFEAANDRGLPLHDMEKVRNYLISKSMTYQLDLKNEIQRTWSHIFTNMKRYQVSKSSDEDQLLRQHWLVFSEKSLGKGGVYGSVKDYFDKLVKNHENDRTALVNHFSNYLRDLVYTGIIFINLYNPTSPFALEQSMFHPEYRTAILDAIINLNYLGKLAKFLPIIVSTHLRCCHDYPDNPEEYSKQLLLILQLCEMLTFCLVHVNTRRADAGGKSILNIARNLFHRKISIPTSRSQLIASMKKFCTEGDIRIKFNDKKLDYSEWSGIKYFLLVYEKELAENFYLTNQETCICRVLPKGYTLYNEWKKCFKGISEKEGNRLVNSLGNLYLDYKNGEKDELKKGYDHKKQLLESSTLLNQHEIAENEVWNANKIEIRRSMLATWGFKRFNYVEFESTLEQRFEYARKVGQDQYHSSRLVDLNNTSDDDDDDDENENDQGGSNIPNMDPELDSLAEINPAQIESPATPSVPPNGDINTSSSDNTTTNPPPTVTQIKQEPNQTEIQLKQEAKELEATNNALIASATPETTTSTSPESITPSSSTVISNAETPTTDQTISDQVIPETPQPIVQVKTEVEAIETSNGELSSSDVIDVDETDLDAIQTVVVKVEDTSSVIVIDEEELGDYAPPAETQKSTKRRRRVFARRSCKKPKRVSFNL